MSSRKAAQQCGECGGSGLCDHAGVRSRCKECGGSGFYEHGRQRHRCNSGCVNTEDSAAYAGSVVALVSMKTENGAAYARSVVALVCVNT